MKWKVELEKTWRRQHVSVVFANANDPYDRTTLEVICPNANDASELQLAMTLCKVLNKACAEGKATLSLVVPK
jgi:hypothetical protein